MTTQTIHSFVLYQTLGTLWLFVHASAVLFAVCSYKVVVKDLCNNTVLSDSIQGNVLHLTRTQANPQHNTLTSTLHRLTGVAGSVIWGNGNTHLFYRTQVSMLVSVTGVNIVIWVIWVI